MLERLGEASNLIICGTALIVWLFIRFTLFSALDRDREPGEDRREGELAWVPWAFDNFLFAWVCWAALYSLRLWEVTGPPQFWRFLGNVLSDLNTTFLFLVGYAVARGSSLRLAQYRLIRSTLFCVVMIADVVMYAAGLALEAYDSPQTVLEVWSVGYAIAGLMVLGHAFKLRYGTWWVLGVAAIYALVQPFAYVSGAPGYSRHAVTVEVRPEVAAKIQALEVLDADFARLSNSRIAAHSFTAEEPFSAGLGGEVPIYLHLRRDSGEHRLDGYGVIRMLRSLHPYLGRTATIRSFLRLRLDDIVFFTLALGKVLLGYSIFRYLQMKPESADSVLNDFHPPAATERLVRQGIIPWASIVVGLMLVVVAIGFADGFDTMLFFVVLSLIAFGVVSLLRFVRERSQG